MLKTARKGGGGGGEVPSYAPAYTPGSGTLWYSDGKAWTFDATGKPVAAQTNEGDVTGEGRAGAVTQTKAVASKAAPVLQTTVTPKSSVPPKTVIRTDASGKRVYLGPDKKQKK